MFSSVGLERYLGEVAWNTDRNENIQRISSIHLNEHYGFNKLFEIKKCLQDIFPKAY